MTYENGKKIQLGDKVSYAGMPGRIVFIVDEDLFLPSHPREEWSYVKQGLGVQIDGGDLFCLQEPDGDLIAMS
jgi:hypothetical protein